MECTGKIVEAGYLFPTKKTLLTAEINENVLPVVNELKSADMLEFRIRKGIKKRSLDANAYFWLLIGKLAQKLKLKAEKDVYKQYIRETGAFKIYFVKKELLCKFKEVWEKRGLGWIAEDIGPSRVLNGYNNVLAYYGTSFYNQEEMAHIIDLVVQDCRDFGILTESDNEIERLKKEWEV